MATHPMSAVDAAWYHIDGPANLAMITGILLTRRPLDFERVRAVYRERLAGFDRFHQRVVERGLLVATPCWEDMPHFSIDQHLHHVALPASKNVRENAAALRALITDIASAPLDHEQPLWQVHVVDGVRVDGEHLGSALIMRSHHCMADGTAMMAVIQRLFDAAPGVPAAGAPAASRTTAKAAAKTAKSSRTAQRVTTRRTAVIPALAPAFDAIESAARDALQWASNAAGAAADALAHPQQTIEQAAQQGALVLGGAGVLLTELFKSNDPPSPLKGDFGLRKSVAWSQPVRIADVKAIGARFGAKVNDVLVAGMAGALRHYLKGRGVDVAHTTVRAMVPVDLRARERFGELGNDFGLVILELPVAEARSAQRVAATKARMDALKRSPEPVAMRFLFEIFGRGPKALEDLANQIFGAKASVVMTNVAGPRETLTLAGVPIERMMFWVPHPGRQLGMGISIMSYRGEATLAVIADARLVPDPEVITARFNREFEAMLRAARRSPAPAVVPAVPKAGAKARSAGPAARAVRAAQKKASRRSAKAALPLA